MAKSKVYFCDFRTHTGGASLPQKLQKLMRRAGIGDIDFDNKFTAIKMHFGELGNLAFLRPNYAKAVADVVKELGGKPFLTDCNTLYPGSRKNALEHLMCAWENGFSYLSTGCPILIGDGLKGTDEVYVPVEGGEYVQEAKIGHAIMDADVFISLAHFKGHECAGFGGAIKNVGMGCGSRAGKMEQHNCGKPVVDQELCRGCQLCARQCGQSAISYGPDRKASIDHNKCVGCGRCIGACNFDAISNPDWSANAILNCKMAEYTKAVVSGRPAFYVNIVMDISPTATAMRRTMPPFCPTWVCSVPLIRWLWIRPAPTPACARLPLKTPSWERIWPVPTLRTTMTTSPTPPRSPSGRPAWSTPRRSVWAAVATN